jgi:transcriptional regulator with XRE-family HTH domain
MGRMPRTSPDPVDKHVGSRVRMRRMMLGMSQQTLGDALGLTFQQVQKNEKGTNRIGAGRLYHLARILGVPVGFFFEGAPHVSGRPAKGDTPSPAYVADFLAKPDGLAIARAFMRINDVQLQHRIADLIEAIVKDSA